MRGPTSTASMSVLPRRDGNAFEILNLVDEERSLLEI